MIDIAKRLTTQLASMTLKRWAYSVSQHEVPIIKLTLFFEGLMSGSKTYEDDRAACFADESRKLARDALFMVLRNLDFFHQSSTSLTGLRSCRWAWMPLLPRTRCTLSLTGSLQPQGSTEAARASSDPFLLSLHCCAS